MIIGCERYPSVSAERVAVGSARGTSGIAWTMNDKSCARIESRATASIATVTRREMRMTSKPSVADSERSELMATVRLAVPVAFVQLAFMTMGVVDTLMVGRLSARVLAAVA